MLKGSSRVGVWCDSFAKGRDIKKLVLKPGALSASFVRADGVSGQMGIVKARNLVKDGPGEDRCVSRLITGAVCGRNRPCRYHG